MHNNGGRNPDWTGKNNLFTFHSPSNALPSKLAVVPEVYDFNSTSSDEMIDRHLWKDPARRGEWPVPPEREATESCLFRPRLSPFFFYCVDACEVSLRLPVASVDGVCVVAVAGDLAAACWLWESMWFVLNWAVCGG